MSEALNCTSTAAPGGGEALDCTSPGCIKDVNRKTMAILTAVEICPVNLIFEFNNIVPCTHVAGRWKLPVISGCRPPFAGPVFHKLFLHLFLFPFSSLKHPEYIFG
jgi:hypothetical protein